MQKEVNDLLLKPCSKLLLIPSVMKIIEGKGLTPVPLSCIWENHQLEDRENPSTLIEVAVTSAICGEILRMKLGRNAQTVEAIYTHR